MNKVVTASLATKPKVLSLYKRILRTGKNWEEIGGNPEDSQFILTEARDLFHKNKDIQDNEKIETKIFEGESRLELALHYKIPYPRLFNIAHGTNVESDGVLKGKVTPKYMDSYKDEENLV